MAEGEMAIGADPRLRLRVGCTFEFATVAPVAMLMLVRPRPDGHLGLLRETRSSTPELPLRDYVDAFGNICWRFNAPAGQVELRYEAVVEVTPKAEPQIFGAPLTPQADLPDETLVFTLPSRQVESDLLLADAWRLFGETAPTWARVQAVCDWVHEHVSYDVGASGPGVLATAVGTYQRRRGVCRDFALLAIAFCRALNIPARYAFGYLPDIGVEPSDTAMDFHAWFEAHVGGRWHTFDARHNRPRVGRVLVGRGRDAVDAALTTAYGAANLERMSVWADAVAEPTR